MVAVKILCHNKTVVVKGKDRKIVNQACSGSYDMIGCTTVVKPFEISL